VAVHYLKLLGLALGMVLMALPIYADTPVTADTTGEAPKTFIPEANQTLANGPKTMQLDPHTHFPPGGPPYSLFSPFEFYARPFVGLNTGRGQLADVLTPGVGADFGVRSLLYNEGETAAWYGDLGLGYQYNNSHDSDKNIIVRDGPITVTRLGSPIQLDAVTSLGVVSLHRIDARFAFGREFYFQLTDCISYSLGGDVGGTWGQASIKTVVNNRNITGSQTGDVISYDPKDGHSSQVTKGYFLGTNANLVFHRRTHDFVIGSRFEWQQQYFNRLVDDNDGASQIKLMLEIGWRY
jgi:hypothetical protein